MTELIDTPRTGVPSAELAFWSEAFAPLRQAGDDSVDVRVGWDLHHEQDRLRAAAAAGRGHVSVRVNDDEILIGPRWVPGTDAGCAGCAELRTRLVTSHPLVERLDLAAARPRPRSPLLPALLEAVLAHLRERPLEPGELFAVGGRSTRRHRVVRSAVCPVCAPAPDSGPNPVPPPQPESDGGPLSADDPTRGLGGGALLAPGALRARLVDGRFGPVMRVLRESRAPFAMSMAAQPDSIAMGYGRAADFDHAEPVALLEAYERLAGFPHQAARVTGRSLREVAEYALDPAGLGRYTAEQLASPRSRVTPSDADTPMDWVWGHDLADGTPRLVPADIAFYQWDYAYGTARHTARTVDPHTRRHYFHESSSGCALGSSRDEASLHSLLELAERDAFLLAWHRAAPLPAIRLSSVTDPVSRRLLELIASRGFDAHLLAATSDLGVPVVWGLAVNRLRPFPATFSAAGSGADPEGVVRAALWELAQVVTDPVDWDRGAVEPMLDDPWLVDQLDDHIRLHALPEKRDRVTAVLGGPETTLAEAFPGWPDRLRKASGGRVRGALEYVAGLYRDAGLERIVLVDQSTREHTDLGLAVVKAVVPGIVPMCFGHAQQRLAGLERLSAALAGTPGAGRDIPYDPHPFP